MESADAMRSVEDALQKTGLQESNRPRLLSDNGSCYVSNEFSAFISNKEMGHVRGAPYHPQTQGKIERYHRSMKNVVKLDHYYAPEELQNALEKFVHYYNNERYHESLNNLTPADVYFGRGDAILTERKRIKKLTLLARRKEYQHLER